jgi:uncharacterized protein (DUF2141 family)
MNFHLNKSWISKLLIAITISIVLVLIINNAQAQETYTITGDISFQHDGDIYIRICTMEEWAEFLKPNYELSVPPWKMIRMNSETKKTGKVSFKLDSIPKGTYVIVAFQDIIKNQKVDYEGMYMKEPWSTYKEDDYLGNRPRWDIVKFNLEKNIGGIKIQL